VTSGQDTIKWGTQPNIDAAFIQFAGFTAGRMPEVFAGDWFGNMMGYQHFPSFSSGVYGMSYTAVFGGGFAATVAFEDNKDFAGANLKATDPVYQTPYDALPVLVGKLSLDQSWGQIQVSGAAAQNRSVRGAGTPGTVVTYDVTKSGYALGGQLTLNADMISKGDKFFLLGGMSNGINALGFRISNVDSEARNVDGTPQSYKNFTCNAAGTVCQNTTSTYVNAAFLHYWTPSVRQNVTAGMAWVDPGLLARTDTTVGLAATQKASFTQIGTNIFWSPVKNLDIGVEVMYDRVNVSPTTTTTWGCGKSGAAANCTYSGDSFITRFRVQRDF